MSKIKLIVTAALLFSFFGVSSSYARNVTCRVVNQKGEIAGVYVHSSASFPACSCSNEDLPEKFKSVCANSLKSF